MQKMTSQEKMELLKEKLKDNPRALAELELWSYQNATEWYHGKLTKNAIKAARINRFFLR